MEQVRIGRYFWIFSAAFIGTIILALSVFFFTEYDPGGSVGIIETFLAIFVTVFVFVRDNNRLPTHEERQKLVNFSFAMSILVVIIPVFFFMAYLWYLYGFNELLQGLLAFFPKFSILTWALITVAMIGFSYAVVSFGYWFSSAKLGKYFLVEKISHET